MSTTTEIAVPGLSVGTWVIDPSHSEVGFSVRHLMVSKVRGRFGAFEGEIDIADEALDSSTRISIDVASVDTRDDKRDEHLRSPDFFDAEQYPKMTFASTGVRHDGDDFVVDGDLTIRGVTKPVSLALELNGVSADPWGGTRAGFSAETEVNRKDWDMAFNIPLEGGGVVVGDKVKVHLEVEAVLQQPTG